MTDDWLPLGLMQPLGLRVLYEDEKGEGSFRVWNTTCTLQLA
jgi:hypothetical protein